MCCGVRLTLRFDRDAAERAVARVVGRGSLHERYPQDVSPKATRVRGTQRNATKQDLNSTCQASASCPPWAGMGIHRAVCERRLGGM